MFLCALTVSKFDKKKKKKKKYLDFWLSFSFNVIFYLWTLNWASYVCMFICVYKLSVFIWMFCEG